MEHPFTKSIRVHHAKETEEKVYAALGLGYQTARELGFHIFGSGSTRTPGRSKVGKALATLERRGEVSRDIGVGVRGSDHWFITGYISDGPCPNEMESTAPPNDFQRLITVECKGFLRVVITGPYRLKCDACGARFVENQSFTTQSEQEERQQIARLLGRPVTEKQVVS
jgi:hypothetical protein